MREFFCTHARTKILHWSFLIDIFSVSKVILTFLCSKISTLEEVTIATDLEPTKALCDHDKTGLRPIEYSSVRLFACGAQFCPKRAKRRERAAETCFDQ